MFTHPKLRITPLKYMSISFILMSYGSVSMAQDIPIVQPGAPGKTARTLNAEEAIKITNTRHSPDDVMFMQNMIPHHDQALKMAALVADRTNRQELIDVAGRINASQEDEITFMQQWLLDRGIKTPDAALSKTMHASHAAMGMASAEQMAALAQAAGTEFDRQFLALMITHHKGAVRMVSDLHAKPGSAYDPVLFDFTNDITNDQASEIGRMNAVLTSLSSDPRADLTAGFNNAGQAAKNLNLLASLSKPRGFFDPENPSGLPPVKSQKNLEDAEKTSDDDEANEETEWSERSPLLSFSNTDMAFSGDTLIVGNYHGFNAYKLPEDGIPQHISSVVCPGGQGDVSIVGDLLIMSVEQTRGRVDCGLEGINEDISADRFRGLRIFDISDLTRPVQVGQVQTCRGSHTHSVVSGPDEDGKIIVYNSGTASVRDEKELAGCIGDIPGDDRTALFRIDVIEIPVDDPSKARIIDSPAVFADPETGRLAGLWQGGDHGENTQKTFQTDQCHDITVFPELNIAAGACSGNGILFDISDPLNPQRLDAVTDKGFAYWHSATFNNDGTKVLFTDEWGGGGRPRCRAYDQKDWGADAIYDIIDGKLEFRSYFKLPAPQTEEENCVAHNGSIIPVPGRDIFVQAWYQGGLSVIDFTNSDNPVEIAYFDRGPVHEDVMIIGGYWSTYWYKGKIYGSEIVRGLDILSLAASDHLSENEIAAAALANQNNIFNPQQQYPVSWPAEPVVARAYADQLDRMHKLAGKDKLRAILDQVEANLINNNQDKKLADELQAFAQELEVDGGDIILQNRRTALRDTLKGIAERLE